MTPAEIIAMALAVGVKEYGPNTRNWSFDLSQLERFTTLAAEKAAAKEREACLKIADDCADADMHASMAANAIRARSK